jgi:hypothetical protein
MVTGDLVAVKVIKNKPAYLKQSAIEVEILKHVSDLTGWKQKCIDGTPFVVES